MDRTQIEKGVALTNGVSYKSCVSLSKPVIPTAHVEICQKLSSTARADIIKKHVIECIKKHGSVYGDFVLSKFDDPFLEEHVNSIAICDTDITFHEQQMLSLDEVRLELHVFYLQEDGPGQEELDDEELAAAQHWLLPARDFHGIWDNLFFDNNVKGQLLQYARSTLLFSDKKVDTNVISWNRVILLHGPPGTGKTSLCKALAQKLSIQMSHRYSYGQLIEINSHSLFSKWFSESGKLVMKMFQKIQELIDDPNGLVCVLIDEVESLTAARKSAMSGTEPSDAIRVVNAVLTQIDQIKRYPNVIILTTSNVTGAIDLAFVDRADIKQYIGPLPPNAIYKIYQSGINELTRAGIIEPGQQILDLRSLELMRFQVNDATTLSLQLRDVAVKSHGLSGRTLRKLPFIAHAVFLQASEVSLADFIQALSKSVDKQFEERENLTKE